MEGSGGSIIFITWKLISRPSPESFLQFFKPKFMINPQGYTIIKSNPDLDNIATAFVIQLHIPIAPIQTVNLQLLWTQPSAQKIIAFVRMKDLAAVMPIDPNTIVVRKDEFGNVTTVKFNEYESWCMSKKVAACENVVIMQTLPDPRLARPGGGETPEVFKVPPSSQNAQELVKKIGQYARSVYLRYAQQIADLQQKCQPDLSAVLQKAANQQAESMSFVRKTDEQLSAAEGKAVSELQTELTELQTNLAQLQGRVRCLPSLLPMEVQFVKAADFYHLHTFLAFRLLCPSGLRCVLITNEPTLPEHVYLESEFTLVAVMFDMPQGFDITMKFIDFDTQVEVAKPLRLTETEFRSSKFSTVQIDENTITECHRQQEDMKVRYEQERGRRGKR